jgi:adenosylcobinamide-phosphate synthase
VNTLDAMVGHRNERYTRFGTAAARADDFANLIPSRLTAALTVMLSPLVGGHPGRTAWIWFRDGNRHPSPNAGQCEAAMAGALGIRLGGRNVYFGHEEDRPFLGDGRPPVALDIHRATRLSAAVGAAAVAIAAARALTGPLWRQLLPARRGPRSGHGSGVAERAQRNRVS